MNNKIKLIECMRTWQGEGIDAGKQALLCRFKYCNRSCKYCDTIVKMRVSKESEYDIKDLQKELNKYRLSLIITGGEPTIPRHIDEAAILLNELDYILANVETNGFQLEKLIKMTDPAKNVHFIYSPKIFNEHDLKSAVELTTNLLPNNKVFIKVVYEDDSFIKDYLEWLSEQITFKQSNKVWLMSEGATRVDLIKNSSMVFDACEKYRFNFSSRDHIVFNFI